MAKDILSKNTIATDELRELANKTVEGPDAKSDFMEGFIMACKIIKNSGLDAKATLNKYVDFEKI